MQLARDNNGIPINGFCPRKGVAENLSGDVTPNKLRVVKLGSAVDITIDGKKAPYPAGYELIMEKGVTYTFSLEVEAHEM